MVLHTTRAAREVLVLGSPRLYREELEKITRIVEEECSELRIDFYDDRGRVGRSPEAFAEYGAQDGTDEVLRRVTIVGTRGPTKLTVDFTPTNTVLSVTNPDNSTRGAAHQIRDLCRDHRRLGDDTHEASPGRRGLVVAAVACSLLYGLFVTDLSHEWSHIAVLGTSWSLGFTLLLSWPFARGPLLINAPRADRPPWWERHGKDAGLLVAGGLIGYGVSQVPALMTLIGG